MVITGVAERAPDRLQQLVYLDPFVPRDDESMRDIIAEALGPAAVAQIDDSVRIHGDGWRFPRSPVDSDGVPNPRATDHPYQTITKPIRLASPAAASLPHCYVLCTNKPPGVAI